MTYAELQVTTDHSFLRGASRIEEIFATAAALGLSALGITDRATVGGLVRAHQRATETGVRLVPGCRLDPTDAPPLLLYPTDRAAWSRLTRLLTLGKRRAGKGGCTLAWADITQAAEGMLAVLVPDGTETLPAALDRLREAFADRAYLAFTPTRRPNEAARLETLARLARAHRIAPLATGDVLVPCPRAPHPGRRAHLHPRRLHDRRRRLPPRPRRRAPSARPRRDGPPARPPPGGARAHRRDPGPRPLLPRRPRLPVSDRNGRPRPHPAADPGPPHLGRRRPALPGRHPRPRRRAVAPRIAADRYARLRPLFPHREQHRPLRPRPRHPLPGPRQRGEQRGLLRARHHRDRPGPLRPAVRALRLRRPPRAARHRCRFRARAARGRHPVDLPNLRPRPRRALFHRDPLPRPRRRARRGQGARPVRGHHRRARPPGLRLVRRRHHGGPRRRAEPEPGRPSPAPDARARPDPDRFPPPPLPAPRRLRADAGPAGRAGADRARRDGRPPGDRVGQGRHRHVAVHEGGRARPRHARLPAPCLRPAGRPPRNPSRHGDDPAGGPGHLRDDPPRRHVGRVPDRIPRPDGDAAPPQAAPLLRPGDRGRDRPTGAHPGRHGAPLPAPARRARTGRLSQPGAGTGARQDARRAPVPGTGDAGRDRLRRLHRGGSRRAPPQHGHVQVHRRGQSFQGQADRGHGRPRLRPRFRRTHLRPDRGLRLLRFPGKPRRVLRADRLCLVVDEVPPPGRVRLRAAERPADGLLRPGADRPRRARPRRDGARRRRQRVPLGLHLGSRPSPLPQAGEVAPRSGG